MLIEHIREESCTDCEVSCSQLVTSDEVFAVFLKMLLKESTHSCDVLLVLSNGFLILLPLVVGRVELSDEVVCIVDKSISLPSLQMVSGIVAELLANEAEHGNGLIQVLSIVYEDWQLTVGEFTGGLAGTEGWAIEALILKADLCVGEEHTDELNTTVNAEVDDFDV